MFTHVAKPPCTWILGRTMSLHTCATSDAHLKPV